MGLESVACRRHQEEFGLWFLATMEGLQQENLRKKGCGYG